LLVELVERHKRELEKELASAPVKTDGSKYYELEPLCGKLLWFSRSVI